MKIRAAGIAGLLLVAGAGAARADDEAPIAPGAATACGTASRPGVMLRATDLDGALETKIAEQLRAALNGRGITLCAADHPDGAVAELDVSSGSGGGSGVSLSLSVRDQVTDKRVSRELDLRGIPEDGRALVIAEAADELLRASWAELLVPGAPRTKREVPPQITRALQPQEAAREGGEHAAPASAERAPIVEVGIAAAVEHYGSGHNQLGPETSASVFPWPRLGVSARLGVRSASSTESTSGSVDPSAVAGGVAVLVAALPREGRLGIDGGAELFVTHVHYQATALPGSHAQSDSGTAAHASVLARGWAVVAAPLRVTVGLSLGAPLHTVRAVANDTTIAAVSGVLVGAALGLGGAW